MKRIVLSGVAAIAVVVVGVVVWFYTSTNIEDPVEVTAPVLDTTAASNTGSVDDTSGSAGGGVFELTDESAVTFEIDEELRGEAKTVVATNTEIAAQLRFDPGDLSATELGTVVIGAQTFETDSNNRNRAIRGPILDSGVFPTIEFVPTSIDGLDGEAGVGDTVTFTVTGDLTIRDVTSSVTFDVEAHYATAERIEGSASASVLRSDYDLQIPSVPSVANVSDEVTLQIDFVAAATG